MRMKIRGIEVSLDREDVERLAKRGILVKADGKTRYEVIVKGRAFPAKRFFHELLKDKGVNLPLQSITTMDAVYALRRLGFEVIERGQGRNILELAGSLSIGGNAVEDKRRLYSS